MQVTPTAALRRLLARWFAPRARRGLEKMARVRVYTRVGSGDKKAMVGYIPRRVLEEIRWRAAEMARAGGVPARIVATPRRMARVQAVAPGAPAAPRDAWQVELTLSVRQGMSAPAEQAAPARIEVEMSELLREARQVAANAAVSVES